MTFVVVVVEAVVGFVPVDTVVAVVAGHRQRPLRKYQHVHAWGSRGGVSPKRANHRM